MSDAPTLKELLAGLDAPTSAFAKLDWHSGLIRLARDVSAWEKALASISKLRIDDLDPDTKLLVEAYWHETYHFLQIATCGYLFQLMCKTWAEMSDLLSKFEWPTHIPDQSVDQSRTRVLQLLVSLDRAGPEGLTTRMIVEADAYLFQHRACRPGLCLRTYSTILDRECPNAVYRYATDYVSSLLGAKGLYWFHLLANLALCTADPPGALARAVSNLVKAGAGLTGEGTSEQIADLFLSPQQSAQPLGTAAHLTRRGYFHPVYSQAAETFETLSVSPPLRRARPTVPLEYFARPERQIVRFVPDLLRPVVLDGVDGRRSIHDPRLRTADTANPEALRDEIWRCLILASLSFRIAQ